MVRSTQTGAQVSGAAGTNRVQAPTGDPNTLTYQQEDIALSSGKVCAGADGNRQVSNTSTTGRGVSRRLPVVHDSN